MIFLPLEWHQFFTYNQDNINSIKKNSQLLVVALELRLYDKQLDGPSLIIDKGLHIDITSISLSTD